MAKSKNDPLDPVLANIEKTMGNRGRPVFSRFGKVERTNLPAISFGIPAIDDASYCGGVLRGKMVEIFGPESSGKSLLSLFLIASAQKMGLECVLVDIEQSFDAAWATRWGVDVNKLIYSNNFTCGENALEYAYQFAKSGAIGLLVIDSTAALTPLSELEGTLEDNAVIGEQARMLSRGCRKLTDASGKGNTTCVFINQIRDKVGVRWGNPETTPGGRALKFYAHQRIRTAYKERIKVKELGVEKVIGTISTATFVKNKLAMPFGRAEFKIINDAKSLNPVVMLCNIARTLKMIRTYNGIFNIPKDLMGKKIETGTTTIPDMANYLIQNNLVIPILDKVSDELDNDPSAEPLDDVILEMKKDPSKIVSPTGDVVLSINQIKDASSEDINPEDLKEDKPEDEGDNDGNEGDEG